MPQLVTCEFADGVATITLNRPDKGNAIDKLLGRDLVAAIDEAACSRSVRAVLMTGAGRAFCVGGDIAEMREAEDLPHLMESAIPSLHAAIARLASADVPVIAALNGPVGGGGIGLALCADMVLAAESVKLRGGYSAIGLTPDLGASWFLARRAGAVRAKQIFFMNEPLSAVQCLDWGIVDAVYPDARLQVEARQLAVRLAKSATTSLQRIKHLIDGMPQRSLVEHLALEQECMIASARSEDGREGVAAFIEKRAARFQGR